MNIALDRKIKAKIRQIKVEIDNLQALIERAEQLEREDR